MFTTSEVYYIVIGQHVMGRRGREVIKTSSLEGVLIK